jgi:hypothetical protein
MLMIQIARTCIVLLVGLAALIAAATLWNQDLIEARQATDKDKSAQGEKQQVDQKAIQDLIRQLGEESYEKREAAHKSLEAIGSPALELLKKVASESSDAEVQQRAKELIRSIGSVGTWTVRIWDVQAGKQISESKQIRNGVLSVAVLPDGHHCVTASRDQIARLWEWKD